MFGNIRHIIAIVIVLILGVGIYYLATHDNFFIGYNDRAQNIETQTLQLERDIIVPLTRLSRVQIDTEFFMSPEFVALKDMSVGLRPPALARPNPFAPSN